MVIVSTFIVSQKQTPKRSRSLWHSYHRRHYVPCSRLYSHVKYVQYPLISLFAWSSMLFDHLKSMLQPDHSFVVTQSRDIAFSRDSSHSRPNELLRSRELLRYFTPPLIPQHSTMSTAWTPPSSVVELAEPLDQKPAVEDGADKLVLKSSDDLALRAFSQLLALKLDCERSMISLIDRTNQCVFLCFVINIECGDTLIGMLLPKQRVHCLSRTPRSNLDS
jgi:hypothetical protein